MACQDILSGPELKMYFNSAPKCGHVWLFRTQFKLGISEIGIYMAIVSFMMPLSQFVLVPLLTGKLKIRDRYGFSYDKLTGNTP